jgi:hypothetical protein
MSITTWVSNLGGANGCFLLNGSIYATYKKNVGGYNSYLGQFLLTDPTNMPPPYPYNYAPGSGNTAGPLVADQFYYYIADIVSNLPIINLYSTTSDSYSSTFQSYQEDQSSQTTMPPQPNGLVITNGYIYCCHSGGNGKNYLSRVSYTGTQYNSDPYLSNDPDFGPTAFNPTYNVAGYNDLNSLLNNSNAPTGLATDGTYLYISTSGGKIIRMTLNGASGNSIVATEWLTGLSSSLGGITISDNFLYVIVQSTRQVLKISLSDASITNTYNIAGNNSTDGTLAQITVNNNLLYITENIYPDVGSILRYNPNGDSVTCFGENTKILCFNTDYKEEYIQIKDIRKGTLVKTLLNGYVPVNMIGKSTIKNYSNNDRIKNRLYKCTKEKYPEILSEDLILTGCHSILVDSLTQEQINKTIEDNEKLYVTDKKYRLYTYLDPRSETYQLDSESPIPIYHFALENNDYYTNYGVYANGLLVESCSKRYIKELSGMTLIE